VIERGLRRLKKGLGARSSSGTADHPFAPSPEDVGRAAEFNGRATPRRVPLLARHHTPACPFRPNRRAHFGPRRLAAGSRPCGMLHTYFRERLSSTSFGG
jgi:hypothetical protein